MRRFLATLALLTGYAVSCQGAFDPYYVIKVDIQTPTDQFVIDRAFLGNNTFIAADVYTDGVAYTNLTDWAFRLFYSRTQFATSGVTIAASSVSSNRVYFQGATNTYFDPFDDYWVSLVGTATNGLVKTFGTGRLIVEHDPFAGSPTTLVGTTPLNWNLMGPYSGTWPIYSGNTNTMTVTSTSTGAVLTVASSGGGSTSTLYRVVSTSALIQVTGEYGPAAQIGLSSSVLTTATLFTGDVRGVWNDLQLQAGTVASSNIIDATIATADIADDAVNSDKLAGNAVLSSHISDGEIENADIGASAAIAMSKIAGLAALSNNFVTATGTLATVVAANALKLTSSHWASADSTTNYLPQTGGTASGLINFDSAINVAALFGSVAAVNIGMPLINPGDELAITVTGLNAVGGATLISGSIGTSPDPINFVRLGVKSTFRSYLDMGSYTNGGFYNLYGFITNAVYYGNGVGLTNLNATNATTLAELSVTNFVRGIYSNGTLRGMASNINFVGFGVITGNTINAPVLSETSTFANVISRGGSLAASALSNIPAQVVTGTLPATVYGSFPFTGSVNSVSVNGASNYQGVVNIGLIGAASTNVTATGVIFTVERGGVGWSGVAATQTVNMAGNAVTNLNRIGLVGQTNLVPIRGDLFASNGVVYFVGSSGSASAQYGENNLTIGNYQTIASAQAAATNYARWLGNSPPTSNTANGSHMEIRMNQTNVFIYNVASGKWFRITGTMEWP